MNPSPNLPPPSLSTSGNPNSADQSLNPNTSAVPGFRFHPTEEELISSYLNRKVFNLQLPTDVIAEVDLYKHSPWDLPSLSRLRSRDREWFFFTSLDRKYGGSHRANRATSEGYWKSSGRDREVRCGAKAIGMKKCLVFHVGRCPNGRRTDWLMHEYRRLEEDEKKTSGTFFVVCRVFNKSAFGQQKWDHYGAPFVEDEWEEEVEEDNDDEEATTTTISKDLVSSKEFTPDELMVADGERDHVHTDDTEQGTTVALCSIDQSIVGCESLFSKLNPPSESCLVPGFRFHPTDEELVAYYLKRKVLGLPLRGDAIAEVNLYKWAPWDLPRLSCLSLTTHNTEWYFFTVVDRKHGPNRCSLLANRIAPEGYWKSTGNDCPVRSPVAAKVIGMKKCLIFHKGRSPNGQRTNWVMHEYRLEEDEQTSAASSSVVCRVYQKSGFGPRKRQARYAVPFNEEESEETAHELVPLVEARISTTEAKFPTSETFRESETLLPTRETEHLGSGAMIPTKEAFSAPNDVAGEKNHVKGSTDILQGTKKKNQKIYCIGSQVEVAYIREKLPVAWYTATVMDIRDDDIFSVEYLSLRNDDGTLLSEIVSSQYVRPRSPSTLEIRHFELLDEVEAFYNGGWWPGVVAKVNKGLKYNVKFMHLEEEIEFSNKELRLLYDWVDGQWIQSSQDNSIESQNCVGPESVGNMQLWHASSSAHRCKVHYSITPSTNNLNDSTCEFPTSSTNNVNENLGKPPLTSNVTEAPCGLPFSSTNDVSENSNRFPLTRMVLEAPRTILFSSTNDVKENSDTPPFTSIINEPSFVIPISFRNAVNENSDRYPVIGAVNGAPCTIPISLANDVNEDSDRCPFTSNNVDGAPCLIPMSCTNDVNENSDGLPMASSVNEAPTIIPIFSTKDVDKNSVRLPSANYAGEDPCEIPISSMNNVIENSDICPSKNDVNEALCEYPIPSTDIVNEAAHEFLVSDTNNVNETSKRCPATKDVSGAPCEFSVSCTNYVSENLDRLPLVNDVSEAPHKFLIFFTSNGNGNSNNSAFQSQLDDLQPCKEAKKGETPEDKSQLDSTCAETSCAVKMEFDIRTPIIEEEPNFRIKTMVEKYYSACPFKNINLASADSIMKPLSNTFSGVINKKLLIPDKSNQVCTPELDRQRDKGVWQHATGEKRRKNCKPQRLTIIEPSLEGDSMGNHAENEVVEPPIERLHQTQCGTCSDNGSEARTLFNVSASSSDVNLVETSTSSVQPSGNRTEAQNNILPTEAAVEKGRLDKSPRAQLPLPFEKCSPMWDSFESMEVFNLMPQRPHFRPLEQYCKELREGMAVGLMVTFANLVNKMNKLDIADSRHKFDAMLKTITHLEGHGFDVPHVRAHLEKLLRVKDNQERLANERSTLEAKLAKRKRVKDRLNAVIESIEKASRGLERSLSHLYQGKSSFLKRKRENDSRLDDLEMDSRRLDDALLSAEHDFEATRSAKW